MDRSNKWLIYRRANLENTVIVENVFNAGIFYVGDKGAHRWIVDCFQGTAPADLTGYSAHAYIIRPDNATVIIEAAITGNTVTAILNAQCYAIPGQIKGLLKIENEDAGEITTISALSGYLSTGATDEIIDPGSIVPSLDELLAQLKNIQDKTDAAEAASDRANKSADDADAATAAAEEATVAADDATAAAIEATERAVESTQAADEATKRANKSADDADAATAAAKDATAAADDATAAAIEATERAVESTQAADEATERANKSAEGADASADNADDAADAANAAANRLSEVELKVETLPASAEPTASVTQTETKTTFELGIPTSDLAYATFYVTDDMDLIMQSPEGFSDITFILTEEQDLEVCV